MDKNQDFGHWIVKNDEVFDRDSFGFVYVVTNLRDSKFYIGQKRLKKRTKLPPLSGKKNKRLKITESNWKSYTGSSKLLNADIERYGKENFKFEIVQSYECPWALNYAELEAIVGADGIRRTDCYNAYIGRVGRCPSSEQY